MTPLSSASIDHSAATFDPHASAKTRGSLAFAYRPTQGAFRHNTSSLVNLVKKSQSLIIAPKLRLSINAQIPGADIARQGDITGSEDETFEVVDAKGGVDDVGEH